MEKEIKKEVEIKDDIRIFEEIKEGNKGNLVLIGFPYDEGVKRNGGRGIK
jgi:formiminoglutamase